MRHFNIKLINAICNEKRGNSFLRSFDHARLVEHYSKSSEFIKLKRIYLKYGGLDFCFDSKFIETKMKDFLNSEKIVSDFNELLDAKDGNMLYALSDFIIYSKGYEEGRAFIRENYGLKLKHGGSVGDYIRNNIPIALEILNKTNGEW
jgi:hypothetical protein